jgi:hypothetical protein
MDEDVFGVKKCDTTSVFKKIGLSFIGNVAPSLHKAQIVVKF